MKTLLKMLVLVSLWTLPAMAQKMTADSMRGDGLIVRIQAADLVFIDRGAEHNISRGDLFDIVSSEMLVHPLSDSILAVTPKSVGAIQILQIYDRTSLARLVQLDAGEDPMLKPVVRVTDAERMAQIEKQMMRGLRMASGMNVPRRVAVIPGLYQLRMEEKRKGWGLLIASGASLVGGLAYRSNSNDWNDQYQNLPAGLPKSDYTFYFTKAQDRRSLSNNLFWLAGALYVYNWVDILWLGESANMAYRPTAAMGLTVGLSDHGSKPLLRLTHRF